MEDEEDATVEADEGGLTGVLLLRIKEANVEIRTHSERTKTNDRSHKSSYLLLML